MHENSALLFDRYCSHLFNQGARVLEIGPAGSPSYYADAVKRKLGGDVEWKTLDLEPRAGVDFVAAGEYDFGVEAEGFDIVFSAQVIEHVRRVWDWVPELSRVCRPGGLVITVSPISWPHHNAPVDCWRIQPEGMRTLYEHAGLIVELCESTSLEALHLRRPYPGRSRPTLSTRNLRRSRSWLAGKLGWPTSCAYDMVTIGRKGQNTEQQSMHT